MRNWVKRVLFVPLLFFVGYAGAELVEFHLSDITDGMDSYHENNRIPDKAVALSQNFWTDEETLASEREGYEKRDATALGDPNAVTGLWRFLDNSGNEWIISFSSRTFYKNTIGNTPTAFGLSATVDQVPDCTSNLGKFWCVNGTDYLWWFDGSSTATVTSAPLGKLIESYRNRLVIGWIGSSLSTLRFSESGDGTNWTISTAAGDPYSIQIGGANDGDYPRCLYGLYRDNLIIGRKYDLWAHTGFNQLNAVTRNLHSEIGCIEDGTMVSHGNSLIWLSNRGAEELTGMTIETISEPVDDIVEEIVLNTVEEKRVVQTSQTDFETGTISTSTWLSTTITPGSIVASTEAATTFTDTRKGDFELGTCTDVSLDISSGSITLSSSSVTMESYTDGASGESSGGYLRQSILADPGGILNSIQLRMKRMNGSVGSHTVYIKSDSGYLPGSTLASASYDFDNFDTSDYEWETVISGLSLALDSGTTYWIEMPTIESGSNYMVWGECHNNNGCTNTGMKAYDEFEEYTTLHTFHYKLNGSTYASSGTFLSQTFDTTRTSTTWEWDWGDFEATTTLGDYGTITYETQTSTAETNWTTLETATDSVAIPSAVKRYIRYKASLETSHRAYSPVLDDVTLNVAAKVRPTGIYTSPALSVGSNITSWGPLGINDSVAGSATLTYEFNRSSHSTIANFYEGAWETVVSGQVPSLSTQPYVAYRASWTVTDATDTAKLESFTITWQEGDAQPLEAIDYFGSYWLTYTTTTESGSYNDRILVYQSNDTWTLFEGMNAASFATWRDDLYFGDSSGVGYVYKFGDGNDTDDGSAIESVFITKRYDFGKFLREKSFNVLYLNYNGDPDYTGDFAVQYDLDNSGSWIDLGTMEMSEESPSSVKKTPFPLDNVVEGRELQYRITKTGVGDRLKLYDLLTQFELKEAR